MAIKTNKHKVFNDPVYGFITIPYKIIFDLIEHPYFQRLRRISQLGLSHLVYPGALHNRYQHAIGASHLMFMALEHLKNKDVEITEEESKGAMIAILLHDIGHGPFSHALEHSLVKGSHHEELSLKIMESLNNEFDGHLSLGIEIFKGEYKKHFLHQLVSSQLDVDRLDYLKRDSFFSGVSEGVIGNQRIIKMLNVVDNQLVVEEKGIYSIEKFLVARRLMYWQVYLHKTVLVAETLLAKLLSRAKELGLAGTTLFGSPSLLFFLHNDLQKEDFLKDDVLQHFLQLDDVDVLGAIKVWQSHEDPVLSVLSQQLVQRKLPKVMISRKPIDVDLLETYKKSTLQRGIPEKWLDYFVMKGTVKNSAYMKTDGDPIKILYKNGEITDVVSASDHLSISSLTEIVEKYFLIYPRN